LEDLLTFIVVALKPCWNRFELHSSDPVVFYKQVSPTTVVDTGLTPFEHRTGFLKHGSFLVVSEDDCVAVSAGLRLFARALPNFSLILSQETFSDSVVTGW
jgi:hypothetical protein